MIMAITIFLFCNESFIMIYFLCKETIPNKIRIVTKELNAILDNINPRCAKEKASRKNRLK